MKEIRKLSEGQHCVSVVLLDECLFWPLIPLRSHRPLRTQNELVFILDLKTLGAPVYGSFNQRSVCGSNGPASGSDRNYMNLRMKPLLQVGTLVCSFVLYDGLKLHRNQKRIRVNRDWLIPMQITPCRRKATKTHRMQSPVSCTS